jgi:hypothetical protein
MGSAFTNGTARNVHNRRVDSLKRIGQRIARDAHNRKVDA